MNKKILIGVVVLVIVILGIWYFIDRDKYTSEPLVNDEMTNLIEPNSEMANPASVNCEEKGGKLVMQEKPNNGGQYALCYFEDNQACEEWAMFREDCPVGGVKTIGFDNDAQKFCVWSGGKTIAEENALCFFDNGFTCPVDDFYLGTCGK